MTKLEYIWDTIPNKRKRTLPHVLERHAFMCALRHLGYTTVEIAEITGFDHSTVVYASKMHEQNKNDKRYYFHYERFYNAINSRTALNQVEDDIRLLFKKRKAIKERMQNKF